ncbi:MAG: serine/threonine protein kinase [Pyrinomonadaceae bacterium]
MYCPKCREVFEKGSRRFCPTDGSRLLSDDIDSYNGTGGGIFSNLMSKPKNVGGNSESSNDVPTFVVTEAENELISETDLKAGSFFEIADLQPDPEPQFTPPLPPAFISPQPIGRKIDPGQIPSGHVEIGDSERTASVFNDFNADDPESFVGRTVKGRYKVMEFLGGDETGLAYLADDRIVGEKKVLVRILLEDETDPIIGSILAEERVSLSHFSHPNIARLVDSGEFTNGTEFLISEYTDALSVQDILSIHGRFHPARAARIIRQAAAALSEAHQEGIIHRDIRPENLVLAVSDTDTEQVKLANFGASSGAPNSQNAGYKAPEVLDGRVPTIASDIYSLAVVAYEMLTGDLPFSGSTSKELVRQQYAGLEAMPSKASAELPAAVDDVLDKALGFRAASRYVKAREFGDAFYIALTESPKNVGAPVSTSAPNIKAATMPVAVSGSGAAIPAKNIEFIKPMIPASASAPLEPAWKNRSPEPPQVETSRANWIAVAAIIGLLALLAVGLYYLAKSNPEPTVPSQVDANIAQNSDLSRPASSGETEMPPLSRKIVQPPNTEYYSNSKQNLKGDLIRNFVGFSVYYPKDWKVNGPQESSTANARGKFLDISRSTPDGKLKEQMLISYYASKGTYKADADKFPQMVQETNETLKKLLPGYQMVSEGEINVNGGWRAYEVKFQGGGTSPTGEKMIVWGRRLFIPASRPGARNGFEITMLATSLADEVRSVDDVGVKGELASILFTFEPTQNF